MNNELKDDGLGQLYMVATPIGNLEDISFRAVRTLKEVDFIAAEDTRQTRKLLNHYEISKSLISYHEHNKRERGQELMEKLKAGLSIALVTDAGMPGISDPGEDLVRLAVEEGVSVVAIPGASASITGLIISGLPTDRFVFEGFLPKKKKDLVARLEMLSEEERTIILYEAPHRLTKTLEELQKHLGNRKAAVTRELTKKFEQTIRGTFQDIIEYFTNNPVRGEFTIIIGGRSPEVGENQEQSSYEEADLIRKIDQLIQLGTDKKEAFKIIAQATGCSKREIYNLYLRK